MEFDRWRGIHTILVTPFKPDLSLDLEGLRRNTRFAAESSAHVLICLGTQSEFFSLSEEEKRQVARAVVEETAGRKPVVCGVSDTSTLGAVALARYCREVGADAVMVTPPYFPQVTPATVHDHFVRIAREGDLPVFLYNAPARAGVNVTPEQISKLADEPGIIGVKQATGNVTELEETVALAGHRMAVVGGSEAMIWPCLALGMIGSTSTGACFMPDVMVEIYDAAVKGDLKRGNELYLRLSPLRLLAKAMGHAAQVKAGMDLVGLAGGPVRPPLPPIQEAHREQLRNLLRGLKIVA